jgi:hypothetical protein
MSEQITREVHEIVGQFVLDMGRTEYVMDEFVWTASRTHPEIMESFHYKHGEKRSSRPPMNAAERLNIACHFFKNITELSKLHDASGEIDVDEWFENLKRTKDFRNDLVHGNIDLTYTNDAGTFLRVHKYETPRSGVKGKIRRKVIALDSIRDAIEHIRYDRSAFRTALSEIESIDKSLISSQVNTYE